MDARMLKRAANDFRFSCFLWELSRVESVGA